MTTTTVSVDQLEPEQLEQLPTTLEFTGLAATTEDERTIEGLAVPYGERTERPNMWLGTRWLEFAPGALTFREPAQLFYGHDHLDRQLPIGKIVASEDTKAGKRITAKLSKTAKADEVYELLKDGVLDRFSIGFYTLRYEVVDADTDDATLRILEADGFETSVVPDPQYKTAQVESVLSNNHRREVPGMTQTTIDPATLASAEDVRELATAVETLGRQVETLGSTSSEPVGLRAPGESYGEFLQMVARGQSEALDFLAAVTADLGGLVREGWVGDRYRLITERRRVRNFFASSPLPAEGMSIEHGLIKPTSNTIQVGEQVAEGDVLPYGKIAFGTANAPVKTYGGWSDMSRQVIDRSSVAVIERFFDALLNEYARTTEAAVRSTVTGLATHKVLAGAGTHDLTTEDGWIDFTIDAATWLDTKGLPIEGFLVASDVFKTVAKIETGTNGDKLLSRNNGTISVPGLSGDIYNIPMLIVPSAPAGFVRAAHSSAVRSFEDGAAPFRLQDDDITNLTHAMSIYGYQAVAVEDPEAIVAPDETV